MAQSTGELPGADAQNELNASIWDYVSSKRFKLPFSLDRGSSSSSGNFYSRSSRDGDYSGLTNFYVSIDSPGDIDLTFNLKNEDGNVVLAMTNYYGSAHATAYLNCILVATGSTTSAYITPGYYTWSWDADWPNGIPRSAVRITVRQKRGQTDIPAGSKIRIWASDFSTLLALSSYDDEGIPIVLHTSGRAGWDEDE